MGVWDIGDLGSKGQKSKATLSLPHWKEIIVKY
jgi:hypothetical protein